MLNRITYIPKEIIALDNFIIFYQAKDRCYYPNVLTGYPRISDKEIKDGESIRIKRFENSPCTLKAVIKEDGDEEKEWNRFEFRVFDSSKNLYYDTDKLACLYPIFTNGISSSGELQGQYVYAFTQPNYYNNQNNTFPSELVLLRVGSEEYDRAVKFTEQVDKFAASKITDLIPGHVYLKAGYCGDRYEDTHKCRLFRYLGKYKFANGPATDPGKNYTSIPVFCAVQEKSSIRDMKNAIFSVNFSDILCEVDDATVSTKEELEEWKKRFDFSIWSVDFWRKPGVVGYIDYWKDKDKDSIPSELSEYRTTFDNVVAIEKSIIDDPKSSLKCIKNDSRALYVYGSDRYDTKDRVNQLLNKYCYPITLDASDTTLPFKIIKNEREKDLVKWLGDDINYIMSPHTHNCRNYFKSSSKRDKVGLKYITSDGNYKFLGLGALLNVTWGSCKPFYRRLGGNSWLIAQPINE